MALLLALPLLLLLLLLQPFHINPPTTTSARLFTARCEPRKALSLQQRRRCMHGHSQAVAETRATLANHKIILSIHRTKNLLYTYTLCFYGTKLCGVRDGSSFGELKLTQFHTHIPLVWPKEKAHSSYWAHKHHSRPPPPTNPLGPTYPFPYMFVHA